jgi:hypothetical protein
MPVLHRSFPLIRFSSLLSDYGRSSRDDYGRSSRDDYGRSSRDDYGRSSRDDYARSPRRERRRSPSYVPSVRFYVLTTSATDRRSRSSRSSVPLPDDDLTLDLLTLSLADEVLFHLETTTTLSTAPLLLPLDGRFAFLVSPCPKQSHICSSGEVHLLSLLFRFRRFLKIEYVASSSPDQVQDHLVNARRIKSSACPLKQINRSTEKPRGSCYASGSDVGR